MSLTIRAWCCAMLSLNVWFAVSHTLIHIAQTEEEDNQEEQEGEG